MKKPNTYLWLSIAFFVIACINLLENKPFAELRPIAKFMKVGWFILAGAYFVLYRKFKKEENEKISG